MPKKITFDWGSITAKMQEQETAVNGRFVKDERFYEPERDKDGNFNGIIRFLPPFDANSVPAVTLYKHNFKYNNKNFSFNCLKTIGKECPICGEVNKIWQSDVENAKKRAKKAIHTANIYIVKDPTHPENEGKVFLFNYKIQVNNIIQSAMFPTDKDIDEEGEKQKQIFVHDYYEGANFNLVIVTKVVSKEEKFPNYEKSKFLKSKSLGTDEEIIKIHSKLYNLNEYIEKLEFKSPDELLQRYLVVTSDSNDVKEVKSEVTKESVKKENKKVEETVKEEVKKVETKVESVKEEDLNVEEDDDEFFKKLRA